MSSTEFEEDLPEEIDADADGEPAQVLLPFYDVYYHPEQGARVRAGVLNGDEDVEQLFVNVNGLSLQRAAQATEVARGWVADRIAAMYQAEADGEADEE